MSSLFQPSSHPWFSWPISICLHQSYQLTRGLDSSMPATPTPPWSHHLSIYPFLRAYMPLLCSAVTAYFSDIYSQQSCWESLHSAVSTLVMYIKRAHGALFFHCILCVRKTTTRLLTFCPLKNCNFTLSDTHEAYIYCCLYLVSGVKKKITITLKKNTSLVHLWVTVEHQVYR